MTENTFKEIGTKVLKGCTKEELLGKRTMTQEQKDELNYFYIYEIMTEIENINNSGKTGYLVDTTNINDLKTAAKNMYMLYEHRNSEEILDEIASLIKGNTDLKVNVNAEKSRYSTSTVPTVSLVIDWNTEEE